MFFYEALIVNFTIDMQKKIEMPGSIIIRIRLRKDALKMDKIRIYHLFVKTIISGETAFYNELGHLTPPHNTLSTTGV